MHSLSIVIPAYNEEANIAEAIRRVSRVAQDLGLDYEILAVNDGSRDRTGDVIRGLLPAIPSLRLIEHDPNRGYGGALRAGFASASKDLIAFIPSDNQYDFDDIRLMLDKLTPDVVLVSGWRAHDRDSLVRKFNRWGWNLVVRLLFGYLLRDIDCGFKVFRRRVLDLVHLQSNGAMIDTEMLAQLRARGYQIAEAPVTHLPRLAGSPTGANPRVVLRAFRDLARFRLRLWRELRAEGRAARTSEK